MSDSIMDQLEIGKTIVSLQNISTGSVDLSVECEAIAEKHYMRPEVVALVLAVGADILIAEARREMAEESYNEELLALRAKYGIV